MDPIIYDLWEAYLNYGYLIRKNDQDGLAAWNKLKDSFPSFDLVWIEKSNLYLQQLIELGVSNEENPEKAGMTVLEWERNHFLIQHGRIINQNKEGSIRRLLQIAYNAGQFRAELEKNIYPCEQLKYYIVNDLSKVTSYINKISKIPDDVIEKLLEFFVPKKTEETGESETPTKIKSYLNFMPQSIKFTGGGKKEPLYKTYLNEYIASLKI